MKRLDSLLPSLLQQLPSDPETRLLFLQQLWTMIVGADLAAKCRPVAIRGSTLVIRAASDEWQHSLQELKGLLLSAITTVWADSGIDRISVRSHLTGSRRG